MKKTGKTGVNWKVQGFFFLGCMALLFLVPLIDPAYRGVVIWGGFFLTIAVILGVRVIRSPPGTPLIDALRPGAAVSDPAQKQPGQNSVGESVEKVSPQETPGDGVRRE